MQPDWSAARQAWEQGESNREIGRRYGMSRETVRKHAALEGWQRADDAAEQQAQRNAERVVTAQERAVQVAEQRTAWIERQAAEADAAGIYAGLARQAIRTALDDRDAAMTRAAAIAYGILIDKAQLLSGGSTARFGTDADRAAVLGDARERALRLVRSA